MTAIGRTLAQLAGLSGEVEATVDGASLGSLLWEPDAAKTPKAKKAAFSQQAHCIVDPHTNLTINVWEVADSCTVTPKDQLGYMGVRIPLRIFAQLSPLAHRRAGCVRSTRFARRIGD